MFPASIGHSTGKSFVKILTDCLWNIDGHFDTLEKQLCPIPEVHVSSGDLWILICLNYQSTERDRIQI